MQVVVGLGGSAGSIRALQTFFSRMPGDSGIAFVVILHLSPQYESSLAALLQKSTPMLAKVRKKMSTAVRIPYSCGRSLSINCPSAIKSLPGGIT